MPRLDKRGRLIGRNWWREYIHDLWFWADQAWWRKAEEVTLLYDAEMEEFRRENPQPTFKSFLIDKKGTERWQV